MKDRKFFNQKMTFLWKRRIEILAGALVLIGIIVSFFHIHIGGMLVGLGFGICFFEEIHNIFLNLRDFYSESGIYKTLIWIGTILYFLIAIPAFIIATVIGYGVIFITHLTQK